MSNKRLRGVAVHRPILYGSTSTPLSPADKLAAPPDHTHKWTVSVRSAASHPLPSIPVVAGLPQSANVGPKLEAIDVSTGADGLDVTASAFTAPAGGASVSTRGRDQEHDYHKMVGGKDDISHFIKRVQFKLHDTYPQATRNVDKPPFSVTETGWGEFEIQIKVFFVPEANEKPITLFHHLKLHPWLGTVAAVEKNMAATTTEPADPTTATNPQLEASESTLTDTTDPPAETRTDNMDVDEPTVPQAEEVELSDSMTELTGETAQANAPSAPMTGAAVTDLSAPKPALPPVVHSWQYDEIVFPEPMESFYEILTTHPPTPLPASSAQAFLDPSAYRSFQLATQTQSEVADDGKAQQQFPPHPLHTPTGYLFDALSLESQQAESDRLEMARIAAVREIERGRDQLINAERALKEARSKFSAYASTLPPPVSGPAPVVSTAETSLPVK